ncbi:MAG: HIT family protein [Thermoplasmata archaeon]|nr:HIT family protein [Thermoplasmata archaeon]
MATEPCRFCERVRHSLSFPGGVVYEDAHFHATLWTGDDPRSYLGQLFVQSKRHVPSLAELTVDEGAALGALIQKLSNALRDTVHPELVYLDCYMEVVRHVHLFLTARYPGTPSEFLRWRVTEWPGAPHGDRAQIDVLGNRLRSVLARTSTV